MTTLEADQAAADRAGARRRALLEREGELELAASLVSAVTASGGEVPAGGLLMFEGPAGLGKTSLVAAVRQMAADAGCTVLAARGGEREQNRAFHVVRQLFRRHLAGCTDEERAGLVGGWGDVLAPTLGLVPGGAGPAPDRHGVRDALDWLLTSMTSRLGPAVLLVDDAHWADRESLDWLASLAGGPMLEELPVLVVAARRPEEPTGNADLLHEAATARCTRRADLAPLSEHAVGDLVRRHLGPESDVEFGRRCRRVAEGNPYVLGEVLREAHAMGVRPVAGQARRLDAIADAVVGRGLTARLERLGSQAVRLAQALAVLGDDARLDRAAALADLVPASAGDLVPGTVGELIDLLRAARILQPDGGLEFAHPLVATEVYRRTPPSLRGALHAHAARLLVADAEGPGAGTVAAAAHLLATEPAGDPWGVRQLRAAAVHDLRAGAPQTASRSLVRALAEPPLPAERPAVRYELGLTALQDDPRVAIDHLYCALDACAEHDSAMREAILIRLAKSLAHDDRVAEGVRLLDTGARSTPLGRGRQRLQAEHFLWAAFWVDDDDAHARARRLRALAGRLSGADLTERSLLGLRAWYGVVRGDPAVQVLAYAESATSSGMSWVDDDWAFEVPALTALSFLYCDRPQHAERLFLAGIQELEEQGWRGSHLALAYTLLGYIRFRAGRLAEAEADARLGLELVQRLGPAAPARTYAVTVMVELLLAQGRDEEADELARAHAFGEPFTQVAVFPDPRTVRGHLHLVRGRVQPAVQDLTTAGAALDRRGASNPGFSPWRPYLARALAESDRAQAVRLARRAVGQAHVFGAPSALGHTLRVAGSLVGGSEGLALLEKSREQLEHSPARLEYAQTLVEYGAALRRERRVKPARLRLAQGLDVAMRCGAQSLADRARVELLAAGGRPRRMYRTGVQALTVRELQAARLAAAGRSNPQIAAEMGVQLGTVNKHLTEVYAKLGIRGRSGLGQALPPA